MGKERLSNIIKEYRKKNNLNQEEFAAKCCLSSSYISILEREKDPNTNLPPKPPLETYKKLAMGMDMSLKSLLLRLEVHSMFERAAMYTYYVPVVEKRSDILHFVTGEPFVNKEQFELEMVPEYAYKERNTVAIRISDDGLFPEIKRNDTVVVWMNEPYSDGDFVLTMSNKNDVLRCYRVKVKGYSITLYGNLSVEPLNDFTEITVIGRVVHIQKSLLDNG